MSSVLEWDSEFFGARIGEGGPDPERADKAAKNLGLDCLYLHTSIDEMRRAEEHGFQLMEMRLTIARNTQPSVNRTLRPPTAQEIDEMALLARGSFVESRFRRDERFAPRASDFYETWVRNSYDGWAQWVRIAEREGRAVGFITIRDGRLDLMASAIQGAGIGVELVMGAVAGAYELDISELRGDIQVDNIRALRMYEKCGFLADDLRLIYHKWYR